MQQTQDEAHTRILRQRIRRRGTTAAAHLVAVLLRPTNDVLLGVDPVELLVQRVVVNGSHVPQAMNGQDDIGALLLVNHHAVDGCLLTEEQEGGWSCRGVKESEPCYISSSISTVGQHYLEHGGRVLALAG